MSELSTECPDGGNAPSTGSLVGALVLNTRPERQSRGWVERVEKAGGEILTFPCIEIRPCASGPHIKDSESELRKANAVIFTSTNAVHAWFEVLPKSRPALREKQVFAVGPATADALQTYQVAAELPAAERYDSEGLLALPFFGADAPGSALIAQGVGGRTWLRDELTRRRWRVCPLALYERCLPAPSTAQMAQLSVAAEVVDFVVLTSNTGTRNLFQLIDDGIKKLLLSSCFIAASKRIADALRISEAPKHIKVARGAGARALVECMAAASRRRPS